MELEDVDAAEVLEAGVEAAAKGVEGVVDEGLTDDRVPMFAEFGGDAKLAAGGGVEGAEEFAETLFGDAVGGGGIEVADAGGEGEPKEVKGIVFGGDVVGDVSPGFPESDDAQAELRQRTYNNRKLTSTVA